MAKTCTAFCAKFMRSDQRLDPGRARKKVGDDTARTAVDAAFQTLYSDHVDHKVPDLGPDLTKTLSTCVFAVAMGKQTCSAESGHLASARLMFKGVRQMIIVHLKAAWDAYRWRQMDMHILTLHSPTNLTRNTVGTTDKERVKGITSSMKK